MVKFLLHKWLIFITLVVSVTIVVYYCISGWYTHQPLWLHFYSDDSIIWSKKGIFDFPIPKYWHKLDYILTRRTVHSCPSLIPLIKDKLPHNPHSADCDTDHSLMYSNVKLQIRDGPLLFLEEVMKFLGIQTICFCVVVPAKWFFQLHHSSLRSWWFFGRDRCFLFCGSQSKTYSRAKA